MKREIVPVYYDSLGVIELCKLDNTSANETFDMFYDARVNDQTSSMFHVTVILTDVEFESCPISGWVKKSFFGLSPMMENYRNGYQTIFLFEKPSAESPKNTVKILADTFLDAVVEEIDFTPGSMWKKVSFIYDGVKYSGWTERFTFR